MAVQFYIEQSDRAYKSGIADEAIKAGTFVDNGGSGVTLADAQNARVDGLALFSEEFLVGEDEDDVVDEIYAVDDRVKYAPFEGGAVIYGRTLKDEGGSAPSIGHEAVVGVIDTSVGDAPSGAAGRLVEEGYTNGATTFNRSNNNFVALGEAYRPGKQNNESVTDFDSVVRLQLYGEPKN
jgi:hypothetical protein